MDDFLIFAPTRWHLRKAVSRLNRCLTAFGFEQHPDKTFIGRVEKGFDWMGFWFTDKGCTSVTPRAVSNCLTKLRRLYEQARRHPSVTLDARVAGYLSHWSRWARSGFTGTRGDYCRSSTQATPPAAQFCPLGWTMGAAAPVSCFMFSIATLWSVVL